MDDYLDLYNLDLGMDEEIPGLEKYRNQFEESLVFVPNISLPVIVEKWNYFSNRRSIYDGNK